MTTKTDMPIDKAHAERIKTAMRQDRELASVTTIRAAIVDVIDGGWTCGKGCDLKHPWSFPTEMFARDRQPSDEDLALRVRFTDAVCERIVTLQRLGLK
jgi:hypothetical protein